MKEEGLIYKTVPLVFAQGLSFFQSLETILPRFSDFERP